MNDLIRRQDAIKSVAKHLRDAALFDYPYAARRISEWKPLARSYLCDAQTVDAVCVVRCKDCEHWSKYKDDVFGNCTFNHGVTDEYFFCADGERKEE